MTKEQAQAKIDELSEKEVELYKNFKVADEAKTATAAEWIRVYNELKKYTDFVKFYEMQEQPAEAGERKEAV